LVDFDNDGWKDVFIGCGHFDENIALRDDTTSYMVRPVLLRNVGGKFVQVSASGGDGLSVPLVARGVAFDDLDNDGRVDVVVLNSRRPPSVLRNDSRSGHHWVQVQLRGTTANRDGVGSRVRVIAGDLVQIDEVHSGRSYQSHFGSRLHFGLGRHSTIDRIEVRWLGGQWEVFEHVAVEAVVTLTQGTGRPASPQ